MAKFYYGRILMEYIVPVLLCIGILIWCLKLFNANFHLPFLYWGDALYYYTLTKTIIENGWVWQNNNLGVPYGLENFDYLGFSILDCLGIKFLSFASSNPIFVENIYYLLTYPLTTLTSMVVFRQFNIKYAYSVLGSMLFTFMPYHFLRGVAHFNLSSYYLIPFMIMVLLWIYFNEFASLKSENIISMNHILSDRKLLASAMICVLSGMVFIYYSYFFCLFLLLIGVLSSAKSRRRRPIFISFILIIIVSATVILNLTPVFLYHHQKGPNPEDVGFRNPADTETYGLKIIQLLLPIDGHRIPILSRFTRYYDSTAPLVNLDNSFSSLGVIAGLGFIILIVFVFLRSYGILDKLNYDLAILNGLSILNLFSILFATIGGFSTMLAYIILPQFRSITRISIFIAFFSVFSILIVLNYFSKLHNIKRYAYIIAGLLLVFGILDQTSDSMVPSYLSIREEYKSDDNFVKEIEAMMPEGAMIFQLPYVPYPQYPAVNKLTEFSLLKGYLHSDELRWSYGAMQGREGDQWYRLISSMPLGEMVKVLALEGFKGIYIDSFGYPDSGTELISSLSEILKTDPLVSENQRLYFFDMKDYINRSSTAFAKLNPSVAFASGFHGQESWSGVPARWMESDAKLVIFSFHNHTTNLIFRASSFYRPRTLAIYVGEELAEQVAVPSTNSINVTAPVILGKGMNTVRLHVAEGCERPFDIKELNNPDTRCLSIAVQNVTVT